MNNRKNCEQLPKEDVWVISKGGYIDVPQELLAQLGGNKRVTQYRISDLGYYMLNPATIQVQKRLSGYEICFRKRRNGFVRRVLFGKSDMADNNRERVVPAEQNLPVVRDKYLRKHLRSIVDELASYDPIQQKLAELELDRVESFYGLYEDAYDKGAILNLQGSVIKQRTYLREHLLQDILINLSHAYIGNGLFELKGYNFSSYNRLHCFRLWKFLDKGRLRACVLNGNNKIEYWLDEISLIHYLQLFNLALLADKQLQRAFGLCIEERGVAHKLLFKPKFGLSYSWKHLPKAFMGFGADKRYMAKMQDSLIEVLNQSQFAVSLNYTLESKSAERELHTHISILHNIKALKPLQEQLAEQYKLLKSRAVLTDIGKYYLLDSIRGKKNG